MEYILLWIAYELLRPKAIWLWYYLIQIGSKK
jgi:hypothetical protein